MVGMTLFDRDGKCTNSSKEKNERLLFGADRCLALHPRHHRPGSGAFMADAGFESFEPDVTGLTVAYIRAEGTDPDSVARQALAGFPIPVTFDIKSTLVEGARTGTPNGKKHYFRPIEIDDACVVHSSSIRMPSARLDLTS